MLGYLEPTLAIVCACIPTLRPIFKKVFKSLSSLNSSPKGTQSAWTVPFVMVVNGYSRIQGSAQSGLSRSFHFKSGNGEQTIHPHSLRSSPEKTQHEEKDTVPTSGMVHMTVNESANGLKQPNEMHSSPKADWTRDFHAKRKRSMKYQSRDSSTTMPKTAWLGHRQMGVHNSEDGQCPSYGRIPPRQGLPPDLKNNRGKDFRSPLTGLNLLTSPDVINPKKSLVMASTSPLSNDTSPTLIGSPASQRSMTKNKNVIRTPTDDLDTAVVDKVPDLRRPRNDNMTLPSTVFDPSTVRTPQSKREISRGRKSPKYVKSPLMGPEKILQGSPRTVHIKTPSRGASIKTTTSSGRDPDASDLEKLPRSDMTWNNRPNDPPRKENMWPLPAQLRKKPSRNQLTPNGNSKRYLEMPNTQLSAPVNANARERYEKPLPPLPNS